MTNIEEKQKRKGKTIGRVTLSKKEEKRKGRES